MTTPIKNEESNLLIMFPASKNFELADETVIDQYPSQFDERFDNDEIEILEEETYSSLDAFMNRHNKNEAFTSDDLLIMKINQQIEMISEAKERLKYYLDELDIYMPKKR